MKKTGRPARIATWLLLALPLTLAALEADVKAAINAEKIGLDDTLIYTLTFRNISNPLQPDLGHWDDFKALQTSRSTELQFSNGASTSSTTFTYYLMPVRTGKLTLPPVQYSHEGRTYQTQALTVEVVKGSLNPRPPTQPSQPSPQDDDFFASPFQSRQPQPVDVRLRAVISKTSCIRGEQLLFRVLLYTRNRIEAVNMVSSPSFAGFWQEWYPVPQSISASSENVEGVIYQVFEIRKAALFASESGTLTIPALQFEMRLADPASMFFASRPVLRSSQPLKITVSDPPLAAAGLPVGQFSFSASCAQNRADINDMVTLRLEIVGSGNCKTVMAPSLPSDGTIQAYPAKISQENSYGSLALKGTVRVEIPVAFSRTGAVTLPSLEFRFFNPESRSLVSLRSQPIVIEVSGEKPKTEKSLTVAQSAIVQKGEDIDFIKSGPLVDQARHLYRQAWYRGIVILLFALNLLFVLRITVWQKAVVESPLLKSRRILHRTLRRLGQVQRYEDIAAIVESYCVEKSGLGLAEISNQRIGELLRRRQVPAASIDRFLFVKGQAELAKFSPLKKSQAELKNDLLALRKLLREIDRKLK